VIGNPPYNANQQNENDNNKNRTYPAVDARIKETYIKASQAQKTKLYDMYVRFFRWASDRIEADGIVAFVSNSSFIHMRTFDGFRKAIGEEFNDIYVLDLAAMCAPIRDCRARRTMCSASRPVLRSAFW